MATKEAVAPLANDPIMMSTLIWSFRHLEHQNLSTCVDFMDGSGIIFLVPFLATKEALGPLANVPIMSGRSIQLFRHLECQNPSIISDSIDSTCAPLTAHCITNLIFKIAWSTVKYDTLSSRVIGKDT